MSKMSPGVLAPPDEVLTPDEWRSRGRMAASPFAYFRGAAARVLATVER